MFQMFLEANALPFKDLISNFTISKSETGLAPNEIFKPRPGPNVIKPFSHNCQCQSRTSFFKNFVKCSYDYFRSFQQRSTEERKNCRLNGIRTEISILQFV